MLDDFRPDSNDALLAFAAFVKVDVTKVAKADVFLLAKRFAAHRKHDVPPAADVPAAAEGP